MKIPWEIESITVTEYPPEADLIWFKLSNSLAFSIIQKSYEGDKWVRDNFDVSKIQYIYNRYVQL